MKNKIIILSEKEFKEMEDDLIFLFGSYKIPLSTMGTEPIFNEHELHVLRGAVMANENNFRRMAMNAMKRNDVDDASLDNKIADEYRAIRFKLENLILGE